MTTDIAMDVAPPTDRVKSTMKSIRIRDDVWPEAMRNAERDGVSFSHVVNSLLANYNESKRATKPRARRAAPVADPEPVSDPFAAVG